MSEKHRLYTGIIKYKSIDFTFVLESEKLKLIPPKDKEHEIEWWGYSCLGNGAYASADPMPVGVDYLVGECNETRRKIMFLLQKERHSCKQSLSSSSS